MTAPRLDWGLEALRERLGPGLELELAAELDSTNSRLLESLRGHSLRRPRLLVAERQSAGRGRLGRQWQSGAAGDSLTFSLAWPWAGAALDGLSLAVGAALAEALDPAGSALQLKWPNDLWLRRRKLGGILIETLAQGGQPRALVLGIGLNIVRPAPAPGLDPAGLRELDPRWSAPLALAELAPALMRLLQDWPQQGFAAWRARFAARDGLAGLVVQAGGVEGLAEGVGEGGELLLREPGGALRAVNAGEASARLGGSACAG